LKEDAQDRPLWRNRFATDYGHIRRQRT